MAPDDTDLLMSYLANRDTPCPRCKYNLRASRASSCPECGTLIQLCIVAPQPPIAYFAVGLLACGAALGLGGAVLGLTTYEYLWYGYRSFEWEVALPFSALAGAGALAAAVWFAARDRVARQGAFRRWSLAISLWAAVVAAIIWLANWI